MSAQEKAEIIALVTGSELSCRRTLAELGLPKSTYYRWLKRQAKGRLQDRKGGSSLPWNKISPEEEATVLDEARASPDLSPRQLAWKVTDTGRIYISESTVYRILKKEGLIKPAEIIGFKAGKEYRRKTKRIN